MVKNVFMAMGLLICVCLMYGCKPKKSTSLNVLPVISLSEEIVSDGDEWDKEDWKSAAEELETVFKRLPSLSDDEKKEIEIAVANMSAQASQHKRIAESFMKIIDKYHAGEYTYYYKYTPESNAKSNIKVDKIKSGKDTVNVPDWLEGHVIKEGGYTNVRSEPNVNASIVEKIKDGSPIHYSIYNNKWCIIYELSGRQLGYMHASKVIPDSNSDSYSSSSSSSSESQQASEPANNNNNTNTNTNNTPAPTVNPYYNPAPQPITCGVCSGTGRCSNCGGSGVSPYNVRTTPCGACGGRGICRTCNGSGYSGMLY